MSETKETKRRVSKATKRVRTIRNMVMMALICVLMLSAATYAWFTLSSSAKITNLTMTVGEESGLLIAEDTDRAGTGAAGTYGSTLVFGEGSGYSTNYKLNGALLPATVETDGKLYSPVYNDAGEVSDIEEADAIMADTSADGNYYCYKTSFYMKVEGDVGVDVKLADTTLNGDAKTVPTGGTYVLNANDGIGAKAIRIRISDGTNTIIYQPLSDWSKPAGVYNFATDSRTVKNTITATDIQNKLGIFTTQNGKLAISTTGTRITLEIWLEGTDDCCVDEIKAKDIIGQLVFEIDQ